MNARDQQKARLVTKRTGSIYSSQKRRAKEFGVKIDYTLDQLRDMLQPWLGKACPFCGEPITPKNFSFDHSQPTSRGGPHALTNLVVCCLRCNQIKGMLDATEFGQLLNLLNTFPAQAKTNLLARLRAGGKFLRN